jgi:hypothetical protein
VSAAATDDLVRRDRHAPHSREEKEVPFEAAPVGVTGSRRRSRRSTRTSCEPGLLLAGDAARALSSRAGAGRSGSPEPRRRGRRRANLVLLDLEEEWTVTEAGSVRRSANSWLLGERLSGRVATTVAEAGGCTSERALDGAASSRSRTARFPGRVVGAEGVAFAEAVFTHGDGRLPETVTDPSFAEQLVCFTAPMVGNYGVATPGAGVAVGARARRADARGARAGVDGLAREPRLVGISGIDTRSLVLSCASPERMRAAAVSGGLVEEEALATCASCRRWRGPRSSRRSRRRRPTSTARPATVRVAVVDYGCKRSILRRSSAPARA